MSASPSESPWFAQDTVLNHFLFEEPIIFPSSSEQIHDPSFFDRISSGSTSLDTLALPSDFSCIPSSSTFDQFEFPIVSHRRTFSSHVRRPTSTSDIKNSQKNFGQNLDFHVSHQRVTTQPSHINFATDDESAFNVMCNDRAITFNPHQLGFIPTKFWPDQDFTFGDLVSGFFQRKPGNNTRFFHKLYNALRIVESDPFYSIFLGVEWLNQTVLRVDTKVFARLLGIRAINNALFDKNGNFPAHGFVELDPQTASEHLSPEEIAEVDFVQVRLLWQPAGFFNKTSSERDIENWRRLAAHQQQIV